MSEKELTPQSQQTQGEASGERIPTPEEMDMMMQRELFVIRLRTEALKLKKTKINLLEEVIALQKVSELVDFDDAEMEEFEEQLKSIALSVLKVQS